MTMGSPSSPTESELPGDSDTLDVPHGHVLDWDVDEVADYIMSIGLGQYHKAFLENAVRGDTLVHFNHEELRDMGISSVGHRIIILKNVYHLKIVHNVPIEPEHYVPVSIDADAKASANQAATQSDIQRLVAHIKQRDERIANAEAELKKMQDFVAKLREEILPLYRLVKEKAPLPTPSTTSSTTRAPIGQDAPPLQTPLGYVSDPAPSRGDRERDDRRDRDRDRGDRVEREQVIDPQLQPPPSGGTLMRKFSTKRLFLGAPKNKSPTHQTYQEKSESEALTPSMNGSYGTLPSPKSPQNMHHNLAHQSSSNALTSNSSGGGVGGRQMYRQPTDSQIETNPSPGGGSSSGGPSSNNSGGPPTVEIFKSFRVSMEDPCYKVLPAALKKYNIQADWRQYALYIVYGDQERCLDLDEKPLILFKKLQGEGRKPMFMLRRNATAAEGVGGGSLSGLRADGINIPPGGII
ncbi:hypothetical protein BDZ91DRAFT_697332 [Kalaharituber pfeilii]|nr:hypothetical protein BDZ91DRAFT_697332 [Kalaharituber pfeilii]